MSISYKILLAEDDENLRQSITDSLVKSGFEVVSVVDGLEALKVLQNQVFDLLLSDIVMPNLDGIALSLKIRESYPDLPIILMSGHFLERGRASSVIGFAKKIIAKPFKSHTMVEAISEILEQKKAYNKNFAVEIL